MNRYTLLLYLTMVSICNVDAQPDTVAFFDFENLNVDVDAKGNVKGSIRNNNGVFQTAAPFKYITVAYGDGNSYRNAEFGNYDVGKYFLYHSPSSCKPGFEEVSFNHIELTLDSALNPEQFYKISFLIANMKSHRYKPSHYGIRFSDQKIIKKAPGTLLSEPDLFFSFQKDLEFEPIQALYYPEVPIKYIYFGCFIEDSMRIDKPSPRYSSKINYSDTAAYIKVCKPTRVMFENLLIEKLEMSEVRFNDLYFEFDSDVINGSENIDEIRKVSSYLKKHSEAQLLIQGYTDTTGTFIYNLDLSARRAEKIKSMLIELGIEENRIITLGKGVLESSNGAKMARKVSFSLFN